MKVRKDKKDIAKIPHVVSSFLDAMMNIKAVAMTILYHKLLETKFLK
jgi:hypothetical protein